MTGRASGWHRRRPVPADKIRAAVYNSAEHKALRARLRAELIPGQPCPQPFPDGTRCGQPMWPGQRLDLGHNDTRTGYIGLVHHVCNIRAAAIKANKTRTPPRFGGVPPARPAFTTSRQW
jgi:hypothetical protein